SSPPPAPASPPPLPPPQAAAVSMAADSAAIHIVLRELIFTALPPLGGLQGVKRNYFRPVVATPRIRYFCPARKNPKIGPSDTMDMANIGPHDDSPLESRNCRSATATVRLSELVRYRFWLKKSFQVQMKVKMPVVASAGMQSGRMTWRKTRQ